MNPFSTEFIIALLLAFIVFIAYCISIIFLFRLRKVKKEIEKEIMKMAYLKAWYKEIAVKIYGKDRIEEKEKEFLNNYNL
jgi:amino acid transporter